MTNGVAVGKMENDRERELKILGLSALVTLTIVQSTTLGYLYAANQRTKCNGESRNAQSYSRRVDSKITETTD